MDDLSTRHLTSANELIKLHGLKGASDHAADRIALLLERKDMEGIAVWRQIRAARALLKIEQKELAEMSRVSLATVKRLEALEGQVVAYARTIDAIKKALEKAGAVIVDPNGIGPGVRLRDK